MEKLSGGKELRCEAEDKSEFKVGVDSTTESPDRMKPNERGSN